MVLLHVDGVTRRLIREAVTIRITTAVITTEEDILLNTVEDLEASMGITVLTTVTILGITHGITRLGMVTDMAEL